MCVKTVTGTKTKAKESKTYICQTYATEAISNQGYFFDRFENVSHDLNLKTKQSANTKQKLHYREHAGQPGGEEKWSKYDMKKKTEKSTWSNSISATFSK